MKRQMIGMLCLIGWIGEAQVSVELDFEKDHYIAGEEMLAQVRITNFSGQTLEFGKDNHWLSFSVERSNGFLVDQTGVPNVKGEFEIPNASRAIRRVNLAPCYQMRGFGSYQITATIFCQQLKEILQSPQAEVKIIHATTLWKKDFGVSIGEKRAYEVRTYSLIRALNKNQLQLYVRVSKRDGSKDFGVFSVGNLVSFGSPEAQIDRFSRLHLLQQYAARSFRYLVISPNGKMMIRQRYDYTQTRPRLRLETEKGIAVSGGIRVLAETDLPLSLATFDEAEDDESNSNQNLNQTRIEPESDSESNSESNLDQTRISE